MGRPLPGVPAVASKRGRRNPVDPGRVDAKGLRAGWGQRNIPGKTGASDGSAGSPKREKAHMSEREDRGNRIDGRGLDESLAKAARANHLEMAGREAVFRRYGYDSAASIAFVLSKILPLSGLVLEVGSGKGRFLTALAREVAQVTSIDIDAAEQRCALLSAVQAGVSSRIRFLARNAQELGWPAGVFDAVVTMNAMHHFSNPDRALGEMVRVLKPSGKLVICDFSPAGFRLMDEIQQAEGRTHPHPARRFPHWQAWLRGLGFRTSTWCGCHQEVLVAQGDASEGTAPEATVVL